MSLEPFEKQTSSPFGSPDSSVASSQGSDGAIGDLPLEVMLNVAKKLIEEGGDGATANLQHLCVLAKRYHQLITPLLYEKVQLFSFEHPRPIDAASHINWDEDLNLEAAETFARIHAFSQVIRQTEANRPNYAAMVKQVHFDVIGCTGLWGRYAQSVVSLLPKLANLHTMIFQIKFSEAAALTSLFAYVASSVRARPQVLKKVNFLLLDNTHHADQPDNKTYQLTHVALDGTIEMTVHPYITHRSWQYNALTLPFLRYVLVCLIDDHSLPLHLYMQDNGSSDFSFCNSISELHLHNIRSDTMVADLATIPHEITALYFEGETTNLLPSELSQCLAEPEWLPNLKSLTVQCLTYGWKHQEEENWATLLDRLYEMARRRGISISLDWKCGEEADQDKDGDDTMAN